jgi:tRNA A-37 threonylcarbamoyl transferase component Bud32
MWKYFLFKIKELFIAVPPGKIRRALEEKLGKKLVLRRMPLGRGWGLKYLAYSGGRTEPEALIKVSSWMTERRLRNRDPLYKPPLKRNRHEAGVLSNLAELGLAPEVLICEEYYLVRRYSSGRCLTDLAPGELAAILPRVLDAIDTSWKAGIFHTDLNAGNVIVTTTGAIHFIDSEIPSLLEPGAPLDEYVRRYCHERIIHSLAVYGKRSEKVNAALSDYYGANHSSPVSVERALELMKPETAILEFPR